MRYLLSAIFLKAFALAASGSIVVLSVTNWNATPVAGWVQVTRLGPPVSGNQVVAGPLSQTYYPSGQTPPSATLLPGIYRLMVQNVTFPTPVTFTVPNDKKTYYLGQLVATNSHQSIQLLASAIPLQWIEQQVSSRGIANGLSTVVNNGKAYGPDTPNPDGPNGLTWTYGINEAMADYDTSLAENQTNPPGCGLKLILEPGLYNCSGSLIVPHGYANFYAIEGAAPGLPGGGSILNYHAFTGPEPVDFFTNRPATAPPGLTFSLLCRNVVFSYEPISTNLLFHFVDYATIYFDNCSFVGYAYLTNGGVAGSVFPAYMSAHANALVGGMLGTPDWQGATFGLAVFNNCGFWNLNAGVFCNNDHNSFINCSFSLMYDSDVGPYSTANSLWPEAPGGKFHMPESCFHLKPGVIDNSTLGDIRLIGCSSYHGHALFLRMHGRGFPIIRNESIADIEGGHYALLQYDDVASAPVNIIAPFGAPIPSMSLVHKPGTITRQFPPAVNLQLGNLFYHGNTNTFAANNGWGGGPTYYQLANVHLGSYATMSLLEGNTFVSQLTAGVSFMPSAISVNGGTDPGINGIYYKSDSVFDTSAAGGMQNIWSYTNAGYYVVLNDGWNGSGGIYPLNDTNGVNELYSVNATTLAPGGWNVPYAGSTDPVNGTGAPPNIVVTLVTNSLTALGNLDVQGGVITNNTLSILSTNGIPNSLAPNGSLAMSSAGLGNLYVRRNGSWAQVPLLSSTAPKVQLGGGVPGGTYHLGAGATDTRFVLSVTTGPSVLSNSTNFMVSFGTPMAQPPVVVFSPLTMSAAGKMNALAITNVSTTGFNVISGATPLDTSTTHTWNFLVAE